MSGASCRNAPDPAPRQGHELMPLSRHRVLRSNFCEHSHWALGYGGYKKRIHDTQLRYRRGALAAGQANAPLPCKTLNAWPYLFELCGTVRSNR
eukprot:12176112-Alexandrium_andersonii.AAC.1